MTEDDISIPRHEHAAPSPIDRAGTTPRHSPYDPGPFNPYVNIGIGIPFDSPCPSTMLRAGQSEPLSQEKEIPHVVP